MKKLMKFMAIAAAMALVISSMGNTTAEAAKKKAAINKKTLKLTVGQTANLKVKNLSKAQNKKLKWTSSKKAVATVNKKGKVTAKKAGSAKITAKVGKKKYTCKVTVTKKSVPQPTKTPAELAAQDRANLKKLVTTLRANGATISEDLDSRSYYSWNEAGRLIRLDIGDDEGGDLGVKGNLDTSCFTELEDLRVESNRGITGLNISGNTKLKILDCSETGITKLDVSKNTALEKLYCEYTKITALNVSTLGKNGEVKIYVPAGTKITGINDNIKITEMK